jgi:plastocyanin
MSNETLFFLCGGVLAVSAVTLTFLGLKLKNFPGRAMPIVIVWFALFVGATTTFAVLHAQDEEAAEASELEHAGEEIEKAQNDEPESGQEEAKGATGGSDEGKESSGGAGASSTTLKLSADASALAFDATELTAKPGKVTIDFTNPSPIPHNVVIEEAGKELAGFEPIAEGEEAVSADLDPGSYTFLCTVPGHAEAGMEGTLVVK